MTSDKTHDKKRKTVGPSKDESEIRCRIHSEGDTTGKGQERKS